MVDSDVTPLVHVGFHRTASSFLRNMVFARLEGYVKSGVVLDWAGAIPARSLRPGVTPIYSNENICGSLIGGVTENAQKLHSRFPKARILVVVRSQFHFFKPLYFLKLKEGSRESYREFVDRHIDVLFDYYKFMSIYTNLYGVQNVKFVLFEDFVASPQSVVKDIVSFAGYDPYSLGRLDAGKRIKPTPADATLVALRLRNQLLRPIERVAPRLAHSIRQIGIPASKYLPDSMIGVGDLRAEIAALRQPINDAYSASNERFFGAIGKDLARYDYPRPPGST